MLTIRHTTTLRELGNRGRGELLEAVHSIKQPATSQTSKKDLVDILMRHVSLLRERHERDEASREHARQIVLNSEKSGTHAASMLEALDAAVYKQQGECAQVLDDFHERCTHGASYAMTSCGEKTMIFEAYNGLLTPLKHYTGLRVTEHDKTLEEVREALEESYHEEQRRLLDDDYRHSSTCAMTNVQHAAQFRAKQHLVSFLGTLLRGWDEANRTGEMFYLRNARRGAF